MVDFLGTAENDGTSLMDVLWVERHDALRFALIIDAGERKQAWYLLKHFYDGLSRRQVEEQDQP